MGYKIIQPPFTLKFAEMSTNDLEAYREWFHAVLPERLNELTAAVKHTEGFENWEPNKSPDSLALLGRWFERQVETRRRTNDELEEIKSSLSFQIDVPDEELTNKTFSLAMDIGMYFAEVVLKNLHGTGWDQPLRNKKFVDYGQPVIMGFGTVPLNPIRILITAAYGVASGRAMRLKELYDTWAKMKK